MNSYRGSFLVADTSLVDPNFRRTVVLILQHNDAGAYGVVVNRPALGKDLPLPVYIGGPCNGPGMVMLHGHREWFSHTDASTDESAEREIVEGIYVGDAECLNQATKHIPAAPLRFRIFSNYSGWGPGQLEKELALRAWITVPATAELLFDVPPDDLWGLLKPYHLPEPSVN